MRLREFDGYVYEFIFGGRWYYYYLVGQEYCFGDVVGDENGCGVVS